jgi:Uma2 family endonuclease
MTLAQPPVELTYEDYLHLPEDGKRHEIIDGKHYVSPTPPTRHQIVLVNLLHHLHPMVREHRLGRVLAAPVDVVLSDTDVVEPDLLYLSTAHLDRLTEANVQGAPDLVVEILSDSTRRTDEITKRRLYERWGVAEYWVVDPVIEAVKVYRRTGEGRYERAAELTLEAGDTLTTPLLPGLQIPLQAVFE